MVKIYVQTPLKFWFHIKFSREYDYVNEYPYSAKLQNMTCWTKSGTQSSHIKGLDKCVWCWVCSVLSKQRGEVVWWGGVVRFTKANCGQESQWPYTDCGPAVTGMFTSCQLGCLLLGIYQGSKVNLHVYLDYWLICASSPVQANLVVRVLHGVSPSALQTEITLFTDASRHRWRHSWAPISCKGCGPGSRQASTSIWDGGSSAPECSRVPASSQVSYSVPDVRQRRGCVVHNQGRRFLHPVFSWGTPVINLFATLRTGSCLSSHHHSWTWGPHTLMPCQCCGMGMVYTLPPFKKLPAVLNKIRGSDDLSVILVALHLMGASWMPELLKQSRWLLKQEVWMPRGHVKTRH